MIALRRTEGSFEVIASEKNQVWYTEEEKTYTDEKGRTVTVPAEFRHDRYTFAPNLPDSDPAIAHDRFYETDPEYTCYRKWDDGTKCSRKQADRLMWFLMAHSWDEMTRANADHYYKWIRRAGWWSWYRGALRLWWRHITGRV